MNSAASPIFYPQGLLCFNNDFLIWQMYNGNCSWFLIYVFLWITLSKTQGAMCRILPGTVCGAVVRISRYINSMGHSRAISVHWDISPLLNKRWPRELIQVCISLYLRLHHPHNDLTQLFKIEGQFSWRLTICHLDLFDSRAVINMTGRNVCYDTVYFYMSILYTKSHKTFYSDT